MNSAVVKSLYYFVDELLENIISINIIRKKKLLETAEEDWQSISTRALGFKNAIDDLAKKSYIIQYAKEKSKDYREIKDEKERKRYIVKIINMYKSDVKRRKELIKRRTQIEQRLGNNPIEQLESQLSQSKDPTISKMYKLVYDGIRKKYFPIEAYFEFLINIRAKQYKNINELKGCIKQYSAFQSNVKTLNSIDFTTICPKRQKLIDLVKRGIDITEANNPTCIYCYVESARDVKAKNPSYFLAKTEKEDLRYQGELEKLTKSKVLKLNRMGGLRFFFSSGDYIENATTDAGIEAMIKDAEKIGLQFKVITKQEKFVKKYGARTFQFGVLKGKPVFNINISVDEAKGFPLNIAKQIKRQSPYDNIRIRVVAFNPKEALKYAKDKDVDVITLLHFSSRGRMQNKELFVNMRPESKGWNEAIEMIRNELGNKANEVLSKICCATVGSCKTCPTACGFNPRRVVDFVQAAKGGKVRMNFPKIYSK